MKFIGSIIIIALFLLGVFLFANWNAMTTPIQLSFLFFEAKGSLGLIFLGVTLVFAILFISYTLTLRTRMLMDARRDAHELQAQRKLAESAETSRFDQLREQITLEFAHLHTTNQDAHTSLMARTEDLEQSLRKSIEEATNSLSAAMGEVDEKLDRALSRIAD
jgi:DNA anti-recombination protein RmuC